MPDARWPFIVCAACVIGALTPGQPPALNIEPIGSRGAIVHASRMPESATITAAPEVPPIARLVMYYDASYARGRAMSDRFAGGFVVHAKTALDDRGLAVRVEAVDATGLRRLLGRSAAGTCLFVPGGFLPDTVRSKTHDDLRAWLKRGGCAVWMGAPFDAYYSVHGSATLPGGIRGPDTRPWSTLYASGGPLRVVRAVATQPLTFGAIDAPSRPAIGLTFDATTFPVMTDALERMGGTPIGFIDAAGRSSVSVLPVGAGRVVLFADGDDDEVTAAQQLAQLLATGAWYDPKGATLLGSVGPGTASARVRVPPGHHLFAFGSPPYYAPFAR